MIITETPRLRITDWQAEDWRDFKSLSADPEVMHHITGGVVWDDEATQKFVLRQIENQQKWGICRWKLVEKASEKLAGFCGLGMFGTTGDLEIGWWILRELWGKGLATEAAQAVYRYALTELKLERIISVAVPENLASFRVMQKIGLALEQVTTGGALGISQDVPVHVYSNQV